MMLIFVITVIYFLMECCEILQRLSNGRYKNVLHRTTVDKDRTRMSWPVFLEPHREMIVGPLPELISDDNPPKYKPFAFKDYSYRKLNKLPLDWETKKKKNLNHEEKVLMNFYLFYFKLVAFEIRCGCCCVPAIRTFGMSLVFC